MSEEDFVTEAVFDYLENGSELPAEAAKNPRSRFTFQTAIARQTYRESRKAISASDEAIEIANATAGEMLSFKQIVNTKIDALVDKVDVRLGLIGGIIIVANVVLFFVVKFWP